MQYFLDDHSYESEEFGKLLQELYLKFERLTESGSNKKDCRARGPGRIGFECSRKKGHPGAHMAGGARVYEVWYDNENGEKE